MANRVGEEERAILLDILAEGVSIAEAARRSDIPYQRAYRIAYRAGVVFQRWEAARERQAEEQTRLEADQERLSDLLAAYHRGELTPAVDMSDEQAVLERVSLLVYEEVNVKPAIRRGDDRAILEALDTLVFLRDRGLS